MRASVAVAAARRRARAPGQPCSLQVNPALYCAFRVPGGVEYEGGKAVLYGKHAEDATPVSSLKPGQRCPGFPFNAHREYERGTLFGGGRD